MQKCNKICDKYEATPLYKNEDNIFFYVIQVK